MASCCPWRSSARCVLAFRPRDDRVLRGHSVAFDETREMRLESLVAPGGSHWLSYVAGVAWAFAGDGLDTPGLDVAGGRRRPSGRRSLLLRRPRDGPARAFAHAAGLDWDPIRMAKLGQKAENDYVG